MIKQLILQFFDSWVCNSCNNKYNMFEPKFKRRKFFHSYIINENGFQIRRRKEIIVCSNCKDKYYK